jgi:hypothetical protein
MKTLTELTDVVKVLGGPKGLAALTSATREAVWNWLNIFKAFPPNTFVIMTDELKKLGYDASPRLWKMRGSEKAPRSQKSRPVQKLRKASKPRNRARTRLKTSLAASP